MKQLDPKAVWLLFFSKVVGFVFFGFFVAGPIITITKITSISGVSNNIRDFVNPSIGWFILILIISIIISYIFARLTYHFYKYELAEDSYRAERGIIWKRYISIPYERIQNIDIHRSILDRLLGLSDLQIHTAGYGAVGAKGTGSEGRLPGLSREDAESLREELLRRVKESKNQGL